MKSPHGSDIFLTVQTHGCTEKDIYNTPTMDSDRNPTEPFEITTNRNLKLLLYLSHHKEQGLGKLPRSRANKPVK
ncbi:hypothetical protein DPMN_097593 [Dreissena polymorpha]|uniref:Uncharacterized protein n=1 Tax=Dreissena polymorpha TaxID=45954 RepID=A0A9D4LC29_DREPO|nr:hypothetical protein DPMN_097593 [Dreissena polymorpha]